MKIIKAKQLLAVPVDGQEPSKFVRLEMIMPGQFYPVHDKTITWLGKASFDLITQDKIKVRKKDQENVGE